MLKALAPAGETCWDLSVTSTPSELLVVDAAPPPIVWCALGTVPFVGVVALGGGCGVSVIDDVAGEPWVG